MRSLWGPCSSRCGVTGVVALLFIDDVMKRSEAGLSINWRGWCTVSQSFFVLNMGTQKSCGHLQRWSFSVESPRFGQGLRAKVPSLGSREVPCRAYLPTAAQKTWRFCIRPFAACCWVWPLWPLSRRRQMPSKPLRSTSRSLLDGGTHSWSISSLTDSRGIC